MTNLKKALLSKSLFRQCYIICLFACNISYVHFAAYAVLVLMVIAAPRCARATAFG